MHSIMPKKYRAIRIRSNRPVSGQRRRRGRDLAGCFHVRSSSIETKPARSDSDAQISMCAVGRRRKEIACASGQSRQGCLADRDVWPTGMSAGISASAMVPAAERRPSEDSRGHILRSLVRQMRLQVFLLRTCQRKNIRRERTRRNQCCSRQLHSIRPEHHRTRASGSSHS